MTTTAPAPAAISASELAREEKAIQRAFRRLIAFLFVLCIFAQLDRSNIGFAALSMNKDLRLTATMFGFANTIFYAGYAICEIPSNVMLTKFGPRRWIARILITWGLASTATMLAGGPASLYIYRLGLGIAEAGFIPGVFLYLTYWFPATYRARATGLFLIAQPVTMALGASASGLILQHANGALGLTGWRWLFFLEGFPAVILGIITLYYLSDSPAQAKWLTQEEKAALERRLAREQAAVPAHGHPKKAWREIFSRNVILLALTYFGVMAGVNTNVTWAPQITREVIKAHSLTWVGLFVAIPAILTAIALPIWSAHSDRKMERTWHLVAPLVLAALGWVMVAFFQPPEARMLGLVFCSVGAFVAQAIFWTIPPQVLSPAARPVGLAFISSCGIVAASCSPLIIGFLRDLTRTWVAGLMFIAAFLVAAAIIVQLVPARHLPPTAQR
jgi:ACS family 4-hydroxyphenylacetate permease-like MFS transporter